MRTETNRNDQDVINAVRSLLRDRHPDGANLEVLPEGVRQEQEWWYVPVRPDKQPARRFEYYEALADIEKRLLQEQQLTVLLVPTAAEQMEVA